MVNRASKAGNLINVAWLLGYGAMLAVLVMSLNHYRARAMAAYGTEDAAADWQQWRDAAQQLGRESSVARDTPASTEPPSLVLMRDHFPACVGISVLLSTCLYFWLMVCVRGVMRPVTINLDDEEVL